MTSGIGFDEATSPAATLTPALSQADREGFFNSL
jgi:hypothetical protein